MTLKSGPNLGLLVAGDLGEQHYLELMRQWRGLDALVQPVVKSATIAAPPGAPADGDCYLIPASGATGAWAGKGNQIARWTTALSPAAWEFYVPRPGWRGRVVTPASALYFDGAAWKPDSQSSGAGVGNRIINGNFSVNQRAVSGTVTLAAGEYGHDRWKAGAGGCTYTFAASGADTAITISAGSLIQVVEEKNIEGGAYTLSHAGTASARIAINGAAPSGSYAATPITSAAATGGQTVSVEFSVGTVSKVQLEIGSVSTPFERRAFGIELMLCQRYAIVFFQDQFFGSGVLTSSTKSYVSVPTAVAMRAAPTYIASGPVSVYTGGGAATVSAVGVGPAANGVWLDVTHAAAGTAGSACLLYTTGGTITLTAEL